MNLPLYIHHIINIAVMVFLFIFHFTNIGGTLLLVILATIYVINISLLIRGNKVQTEKDGLNIDDYKKK